MSDIKTFEIKESMVPVNQFRIRDINVKFGSCATISVELFYNYTYITCKLLTLKDQDYDDWGSDVPYLLNWICSQLSFTLI